MHGLDLADVRVRFREVDGVQRRYSVPKWNFTVANLTLMVPAEKITNRIVRSRFSYEVPFVRM